MIFYFLVGLAMAQEDDRTIEYQKRTEIDFEALDIEGEMVKPQGSLLMERQKTKFNPLIELRTDWNHEMASSVQEIK
jgi:hypothetical protein